MILILLFLVVFIAMVANAKQAAVEGKKKLLQEFSKVCPPHKWRYKEIKDHEGVVHAHKLVCDHCGPLRPIIETQKLDY